MSTVLENGGVQTVTPLQVVYLDFDGANTAYRGELLTIEGVTVQNSGLTAAQIAALTDQLNESYGGSVRFVTERPESGDYSTVFVGATDAFTYHGLAETIDEGNQNHSDNAFVNLRGDESLATIQQIISHEVDHLLGTLDHGGDGLAAYANRYDVLSGVTSSNVNLSYDSMYIYNGGSAKNTKISGGSMHIYDGGTANSTTISGGIIYLSGGTANDTLMSGYGQMYVSSGGTANNTLISSGDIMVFSNGTANSTTLNSGGRIMINSGGTANNTTINWQGSMLLYGGGTANGVIVNSNGQMIAYEQAKANDIIVNSSGVFYAYAESVVNNITVNAGGYLGVEAGGSALNVIWTPCAGTVTVADGAYVTYQSNYSGCYLGSGNLLQSQAATMSGTVISGSMYIADGGVAESAVLNTGGIMTVASGGTASSTAINGGNLTVYSGGSAVNVIWTPCVGTVTVNNGAYVSYQSSYSGCYLGSGNLLQSQAATMSGKTVTGAMYIFSGGTANSAYTSSQGTIYISSGGVANSTRMDRGYMYIYQGGTASRTILNSYGQMFISSGGMANSTTINDAGWMYLLSGGSANNTAISSGGRMYISSGGVANSTTFNFGFGSGKIYVLNGGVASNTTVSNGGSMFIASGGSAVNVQWTPFAGTLTVADGGYVTYQNSLSGCYLGSGNTLQSQAATMSGKIVTGSMYVANGGTADSTTVSGSMFILSGGVANSTVLNSGQMYLSSGGTANSTTVSSGGSLFVRAGGSAVANIVNMSGALFVNSGGTADTTTVSRGSMFVNAGAVANNNTLKNYGSMIVSSGGTANNNTINAGGSMTILSGGTANSTTVNSSGTVIISGGTADSTTINSGYMTVFAGGTANGTIVNDCDWEAVQISSGGTANGTIINSGYMTVCSGGVANSTSINQGALYVNSGGVASNVVVNSGGLYIYSGGSALNVVWTPCVGKVKADEESYVTYASNYSGCYFGANNQLLSQGMTMSGKFVSTSGLMYVFSGGVANDITTSEGQMYISSGGVANKTNVGDYMYVSTGGVINNTLVNSYGYIYLMSGGTANSTAIKNYGEMCIYSGGIANNTVVSSGGSMSIDSDSTANNVMVNYKGSLSISSGGKMTGTLTIANGGNVMAYAGAEINFDVSKRTAGDDYLINDLSLINGTPNYTVTVSATQSTGIYKLAQGADGFTQTISIGNGTSTLGSLSANGAAVKYGNYEYSLLLDSGNLSLSAVSTAIDKTAPTITDIKADTTGPTNQNILVSAVFGDDTELASSLYKIGNGEWTTYTGAITVSGNATVYFKAVDTAGNEATAQYEITNIDKVAPTITGIKVSPTDPTNQNVLVSAVFGDDRELASSQYKIGNGDWTTYTGAITVSGNATVYFKAVDTAGNETTAQYEVTNIDKVAPTVSGIKVSVSVPTNQSILVSAVFDDDRALASSLYKIGDGDWTNYTGAITVGSNGTIYFKAVDTAGNETTAQYNVTNIVDLDPKGPAAVTPTAKVNKYDVSVSWKAPAAQDKAKIVGYEVSINGKFTIVKGTSLSLKAMPISVGNTVQVRAFDLLGRYGALSDIITFDVKDVTGPTLGKVTTSLDQYTATVSYSGSDNVGVDHYQVKCGDQTQIIAGTSATFDHLALGVNNVAVIAYDAAGNASKAVTAKITVKDVTAPDPVTGLATPTVDSKYKATLSWSAGVDNSGSIASYEIQLDNGKILKSTKTTLAVNNLAVGQHSYQVRAIDKAKNVGEWSAAQAFTVLDTTAPGTVSAKAAVAQNSITLSWKAPADNVGVTGYQVWVGASPSTMTMEQMLSADQLSSVLTDIPKGIYYMDVRAIDAANNLSASKPVKITVTSSLPVNIALSSSSDLLHWKSSDSAQPMLA